MKDIAQNEDGNKFALVYFDDGEFKLRTFERKGRDRTSEEIKADTKKEVSFNEHPQEISENLLPINNHTLPIHEFQDPFITCCFINYSKDIDDKEKKDNLLFI